MQSNFTSFQKVNIYYTETGMKILLIFVDNAKLGALNINYKSKIFGKNFEALDLFLPKLMELKNK